MLFKEDFSIYYIVMQTFLCGCEGLVDKVFLPVGFCFDVIDGKRLVVYSGYDNCETAFGHVLAYDVPALGCCSVTLPDVKVGSVDVGFLAAVRSVRAGTIRGLFFYESKFFPALYHQETILACNGLFYFILLKEGFHQRLNGKLLQTAYLLPQECCGGVQADDSAEIDVLYSGGYNDVLSAYVL